MVLRLAGNTIVPVNLEQSLKALSPISVRLVHYFENFRDYAFEAERHDFWELACHANC